MLKHTSSPAGALECRCHHFHVPCRSRQQLTTVCRYDLRKSANNAEERRMERPKRTSAAERTLTPEQLKAAKASIVYQRAYHLCGGTKGQLSIQMCLFLLTEQPQLLELSTDLLSARISSLSQVLGLSVADAAELLVRCGVLIDVLPLRLNSTAGSLSVALQTPKQQSLVMLASDINLLDTPPLRVKQQVDALAASLAVPVSAVAGMVAGCPHILKVEGPAVQIRWANLQALLQLTPQRLLQLLQQEPRLLMPSSQNLTQNHTAICGALGVDQQTLNRWILAAPMVLLISGQQLEKRVSALMELLTAEANVLGIPDAEHGIASSSNSSFDAGWVSVAHNAAHFRAYISKDPRVLLLASSELTTRLKVVQRELMCSWGVIIWLVMQHPSYLVVEPGSVTGWLYDVRHLCQMSSAQAIQLAACPQVFLTMSPEQVFLALQAFSQAQQIQYIETLDMCTQCPLLLEQHPAATAAAMQQLSQLITDADLQKQVIATVPELLLLGPRLQPHFTAAAAALSLTSSQFGLMITNQPSLWWVLVPRQYWQQQQQGLQQQVPAGIEQQKTLVVQTLSALKSCGLRSPADMQEAAVTQPGLLKLGPAGLQRHIQLLQDICSGCSYWQQEFQASLPPTLLGKALLRVRAWRSELVFMVESDLSRRVSLHELMQLGSAAFRSYFKQDYQLWRIDREQRQGRHMYRQQLLVQQQQQQQRLVTWQQQPELGWRQVGDQLQLEQQQQFDRQYEQQRAAAAAGRGAADECRRLFGTSSGVAGQQQQQQGSLETDDPEADVYNSDAADSADGMQWQQHNSSIDSMDELKSSDNYDSDLEDTNDEYEQQHSADGPAEQQQQQQEFVELPGPQARNGSGGIAWQEPFLTGKEMQLLNLQQSGFEFYGSWEGCLLRPAGSLVPQQQQQQSLPPRVLKRQGGRQLQQVG